MSAAVHVLVPAGIDDPLRPSGGNTYDRRVCAALRDLGRDVRVAGVEGGWPWAPEAGADDLARALASVPKGAVALVDGLLASRLPSVVVPAAERLRLVLLVHLPAGVDDPDARVLERRVLTSAAAVVTPSAWCRDWLVGEYDVDPARVHVARPGVDPSPLSAVSPSGTALLAVGSLSPVKGQDLLLAALATLRDLPWTCTCVGSDALDVDFADRLCKEAAELGLGGRFVLAGPQTEGDLEAAYAGADLLVLPSRSETYGMVVTEALARGLPVVAADVGGVREALGDGGLLVPPGGLAGALRRWLADPSLRDDLRAAALGRRTSLEGWAATAARIADVLDEVAP